MECKYCNNIYKSLSALNKHIKNGKICLRMREKIKYEQKINELEKHCLNMESKLKYCEKEMDKYKLLYENNVSSSTNNIQYEQNNNNNIVNINIYNRTDEEIRNIYTDNINEKIIEGGITSIADVIVNKVIKDSNGKSMILITDKSRFNLQYKLPSGEIVKDIGGLSFIEKNKNFIMKNIVSIFSKNFELSCKAMDITTLIGKAYNQIQNDTENDHVLLKKQIIKFY